MRSLRGSAPPRELGQQHDSVVAGRSHVVVLAIEDAVVDVVGAAAHRVLVKVHARLTVILRVHALHAQLRVAV